MFDICVVNMSSSRKRIFGMLDDSVDDEIRETNKEFTGLEDDLDEVLSQSLDLCEEEKHLQENSIDISEMLDSNGASFVAGYKFRSGKG